MPFLKVKAWSAAATPVAGAKLISIWPGPYSALVSGSGKSLESGKPRSSRYPVPGATPACASKPSWPSRKFRPPRAKDSTCLAGIVFDREMPCRSVCSKRTNSTRSSAILDRTSSSSIRLSSADSDVAAMVRLWCCRDGERLRCCGAGESAWLFGWEQGGQHVTDRQHPEELAAVVDHQVADPPPCHLASRLDQVPVGPYRHHVRGHQLLHRHVLGHGPRCDRLQHVPLGEDAGKVLGVLDHRRADPMCGHQPRRLAERLHRPYRHHRAARHLPDLHWHILLRVAAAGAQAPTLKVRQSPVE